jgi:hypothetical protein
MEFVKRAFYKAGLSQLDVAEMLFIYRGARGESHGRAFYGKRYDHQDHDPIILREVPEYLRTVAGLLGVGTVAWEVEHE